MYVFNDAAKGRRIRFGERERGGDGGCRDGRRQLLPVRRRRRRPASSPTPSHEAGVAARDRPQPPIGHDVGSRRVRARIRGARRRCGARQGRRGRRDAALRPAAGCAPRAARRLWVSRGARDAGLPRGRPSKPGHRRHAADLDAARTHHRHDGRGRRRLRRDRRRVCRATPSTEDAWARGPPVGDGCRSRDLPLRGRPSAHAFSVEGHRSRQIGT